MIGIHVAGRNCGRFATDCLASVFAERVEDWRMVVMDDASTDDTHARCEKIIDGDPRVRLVHNETRRYGCWNHNEGCRILVDEFGLKTDDVLVCLDLDDTFLFGCLEVIESVFADKRIWLSYGNWMDEGGNVFPHHAWSESSYRNARVLPWFLTHVLAMRVGLWLSIPPNYWTLPDGTPYQNAWDGAAMFPAVDMAGPSRVVGIKTPIYMHRKKHSAAVCRTTPQPLREKTWNSQRGKPRLRPLDNLPPVLAAPAGDGRKGKEKSWT